MNAILAWLLNSPEPWTRYRAQLDLLGLPADAPDVRAAHAAMLTRAQVQGLMAAAARWPGDALKRHNDAGSMYQAWKGWSFADKEQPSPWLTMLVLRIQHRIQTGAA